MGKCVGMWGSVGGGEERCGKRVGGVGICGGKCEKVC